MQSRLCIPITYIYLAPKRSHFSFKQSVDKSTFINVWESV